MNNRVGQRFLIVIAAFAALWTSTPLRGAAQPHCGTLCAQWVLDGSSASNLDAALDAAMASYKEPKTRHNRRPAPTLEGMAQADMEQALGTITDRPVSTELREELQRLLRFAPKLAISQNGRDVLIAEPPDVPRRFSPGEPHARVDDWGTAQIECQLRAGRLTVTESYDRRRQFTQTYALQPGGKRLLATYEVRRPGLAPLRVTASYQRDPA